MTPFEPGHFPEQFLGLEETVFPTLKECFGLLMISRKCQPHFGHGLPSSMVSVESSVALLPPPTPQAWLSGWPAADLAFCMNLQGITLLPHRGTYRSWMPLSWGVFSFLQLALLAVLNTEQEIYTIPWSSRWIGLTPGPQRPQPKNAVSSSR